MSGSPERRSESRAAAGRVARNTTVRAVAEVIGKFASLALMAVLAREEGPLGLGVLVFALAWCEIATTPVDMGLDRYYLRRIAGDRSLLQGYFFNLLRLKAVRAVPIIALSWLLVTLLGYDEATRVAIYLLTASFLLDTLTYTAFSTFWGVERGDLVGFILVAQRLTSAGLGLAVLFAGFGVVTVAGMYVVASVGAFAMALALLARHVGIPRPTLERDVRRDLNRGSVPYAGQEVLSVGIGRVDVIALAALAPQVLVGYYGAAYRLLEATIFISSALQGAFMAMYTYLDDRSDPTIGAVFQRSINVSLALLVPCGVTLGVLARPILELLFGPHFGPAAAALRVLAPTVVLLGVVLLTGALIASRLDARVLVRYYAAGLLVNVILNLALIPPLGITGAALAMFAAELVLAALMLRLTLREIGPLDLPATIAAPLVAGLAMAVAMATLHGTLPAALAAGIASYLVVFLLVERRTAPRDLDFLIEMLRGRLPVGLSDRLSRQGSGGA